MNKNVSQVHSQFLSLFLQTNELQGWVTFLGLIFFHQELTNRQKLHVTLKDLECLFQTCEAVLRRLCLEKNTLNPGHCLFNIFHWCVVSPNNIIRKQLYQEWDSLLANLFVNFLWGINHCMSAIEATVVAAWLS